MLPTQEELRQMQDGDIRLIDREGLADIGGIQIDGSLPIDRRVESYLEQAGNPFFLRAGDYVIEMKYAENGRSMGDCVEEYLSRRENGRYITGPGEMP